MTAIMPLRRGVVSFFMIHPGGTLLHYKDAPGLYLSWFFCGTSQSWRIS